MGKLSVVRWVHEDPTRGLIAAADAGAARAVSGQWTADDAGVADLRGLVIAVLCTAANAGSTPVVLDQSTETITAVVSPSTSSRNVDVQFALLNGLCALICQRNVTYEQLMAMSQDGTHATIITKGGERAGPPQEIANPIGIGLGALTVIVIGVVAVAGAVAGAISYMHASDNEVAALKLQTDLKAKEHAATLSATRGVIEDHLEREAQEKRSIPWTQQELNFLDQLNTQSKEITGWQAPPLKSVPDLKVASEAAAQAVKDVGAGIKTGTETAGWVLPVAVAAVLGIWLMK